MKRKSVISILTTAALLSSSFGAMSVNAVSYTTGVKQDFETAITTGSSLITQTQDEYYGGVLNFTSSADSRGGTIWFELDSAVSSGKYVFGFDAKLPEVSEDAMFSLFTKSASDSQMTFLALRNGKFCTYDNNAWSFTQIGNASYAANEWNRYELMLDFDDKTAEVYKNGTSVGEIDLAAKETESISKFCFAYSDFSQTGLNAQIDNVNFREMTASASMGASYTYKGKYEVNFSESIKDIDANDFTLTRVPTAGGAEETVLFDVDFISTDKVIITPASSESGYTYTLAYADNKTIFGNSILNRTFTKTIKKTVVNKSQNFENASASGNTTIDEENYRGKFMSYTAAQDYTYKPDNIALSDGQYIFSYDVRMDTTSGGYFLVRTYNSTGWDNYQAVWDNDRRFGDFAHNKGWGCTGYGVSMANTNWHRVDNIMDLDTKRSYVYVDGEYAGSSDLSVRIPTGDTFNGAMISFSGTTGDVDNVRIKSVDKNYNAQLSVKGDLIYIDFDETTYLEDGDFDVKVSANPLAVTGDSVNASLVYNGGARAVLKLDEALTAGTTVAVTLNDVTSFLGTKLDDNVFTASVPVTETTVTVVDDDMSGYEDNAALHGVGSWTNTYDADDSKTAPEGKAGYLYKDGTNGAITLSDSQTVYSFDEVSGGTATIELDVSELVKSDALSADQALHRIMFVDQDGNNWELAVPYVKNNGWIGDNKISFGDAWSNLQDLTDNMNIKLVYNFSENKGYFYYNGTLVRVAGGIICSSNNSLATSSITGIKGIAVRASGSQAMQLAIKKIKVTHTSTPSTIGDISFKDAMGNAVSLSDLKSTISEMNIVFPDGLKNDSADGIISINDGAFNAYSVSYDKATKTAKVTFDEMLGAGKSYTVAVKGAKTAEGDSYINMESSFTTTGAVTEVSDLSITRNGTDIKVGANFVNTAADKDYVMIYAAYNGYELVKMDFVKVNAVKNCTDTWTEHTFENADSSSYTKVTAFIWDSFAKMCPATRSVTK